MKADGDRRRQDGRTVQVHVRATARTNGGASAPVTTPGTCSKPQSPFACGTQAKICFRRPGSAQRSSALGWATARVPRKRHAGCPHQTHAGAAGAVKRPVVPHAPWGDEEQEDRRSPGAGRNDGAMTHVRTHRSPDCISGLFGNRSNSERRMRVPRAIATSGRLSLRVELPRSLALIRATREARGLFDN